MPQVVDLGPGGGGTAAHTPQVAGDHGAAQARRHQPLGATEFQRHLVLVVHDRGDGAVTRQHQREILGDAAAPFQPERRALPEPGRVRRLGFAGDEIAQFRGEHQVRFHPALAGGLPGAEEQIQHRGQSVAVALVGGAFVGGAVYGGGGFGQRGQGGAEFVPGHRVEVADQAEPTRAGLRDLQRVAGGVLGGGVGLARLEPRQ